MQPHPDRQPYSYRDDPAVPSFDDSGPVVFLDGDCALCSASARLIAKYDRSGNIRLCPIQSVTGGAVLRHYGLDPADPESWLYLEDGRAYGRLDAVIRVSRRIGGPGWLVQPLRLLPRCLRDRVYKLVARNRYRLFGHADLCSLPDEGLRRRLMS